MDLCLFATTALFARYDASRLFRSSSSSSASSSSSSCRNKSRCSSLTLDVLKQQNAVTSSALIEHYQHSKDFARLAQYEGHLTIQRDEEDAYKLQLGIEFAQKKGVIDPNYVPEPYVPVDVLGKTPDQVADWILQKTKTNTKATATTKNATHTTTKGSVIVLVGLSGTGKGTTVAKLRHKLEQQGNVVTCWSNGNIFRSVTLLAATWCEQNCDNNNDDGAFDEHRALTKENIASYMKMLSFGKNPATGTYDTRIQGLGLDCYVSNVQNTILKSPLVSKNIPTVAQYTQGEVIVFAAHAVQILQADNICVLLEGREQTVNYVRTPHRFNLILSDESLIGKRRAAQRLMAQALHDLETDTSSGTDATTDSDGNQTLPAILDAALAHLVADIPN